MRLRLAAVTAATAILAAGCSFGGVGSLPLPGGADVGSNPYSVKIQFSNVLGLVPQSTCKLNDVSVGKVTKISLDGWTAVVTCQLNRAARLPANATATIGQTSLLGEEYVALAPPPPQQASPALLSQGMTIPLARTNQGTDIEEVLSALSLLLNGGGIEQVSTITNELNAALNGREGTIKDVLHKIDTFVGTLDTQRGTITTALDKIDNLITKLNDQRQVIADTIDKTGPAIEILKQNRAGLTAMLAALARFGTTADNVINQSQANLLSNLAALKPLLYNLDKAGALVPQNLQMLLTYPFPPTYSNIQRGDYANVHITLDLQASSLLRNLLGGTALGKGAGGQAQAQRAQLQPPQITIPTGPLGVLAPGAPGQNGAGLTGGNSPLGAADPAVEQLVTGGIQ